MMLSQKEMLYVEEKQWNTIFRFLAELVSQTESKYTVWTNTKSALSVN